MTHPLSQEERSAILAGLDSADEEVRRLAVEQLLQLPIAEAVPHLIERLGDSGWRVRKAAVERLVACRDDEAVRERLVSSLADGENPGRRNAAYEALVACGTRATARLVEEIDSEDIDVRKLAIDALAAIGDPAAREPLERAMLDPDANVRAAACEALGVVGSDVEVAGLLAVATDAREVLLVRLSALRALSNMESSVEVARLGDTLDEASLRPAALSLLGFSADPCAENELFKGLESRGRSSREAAISALLRRLGGLDGEADHALRLRLREAAAAHPELVESACERLESGDLTTRLVLIQFLGLLDDARAVLPILRTGRDQAISELADGMLEVLGERVPAALEPVWDDLESDLRVRACDVLGRIACVASERLLTEALNSPDVELRGRAASALGEGGFFTRLPDLVWRLEAAARSDDIEAEEEVSVIIGAIVALAEGPEASRSQSDLQLVDALSSRLGGAPEPVRLAIAKVLARLGRDRDELVIGYLLKDESPAVRRAAVEALSRFGFERARDGVRLALGDESSVVRIAAARVLGDSGQAESAEDLMRLLDDEDSRVVAIAVRSLGRLHRTVIGPTEAVYEVIERALGGDPLVALAAAEALVEVGGDFAGAIAAAALGREEPEVLRTAISCIGLHGKQEDLSEAIVLVSHADWSVRAEAVQVLAARGFRRSLPAMLRRLEVEDDAFVRDAILGAIRDLED